MGRKTGFRSDGRGRRWALRACVAAVMCALCGCSLDDDRDLCCPERLTMNYVYRPTGVEVFGDHIFSLRHFLFGESGEYIGELPPGADLQRQPLDLREGIYTMVTVGNSSGNTLHEHGDDRMLGQFTLSHASGPANADELFWGVKRFMVNTDGLGIELRSRDSDEPETGEVRNRLLTEMNNIHCHLSVTVEWANRPTHIGVYDMELTGVPSRYSLHPDDASQTADGFTVPGHRETADHRLRVPLRQLELQAEFVTLRYTDEAIPTLRISFDGEPAAPDIDLGKAFRTWGWRPSATHVQEYRILVRIISPDRADVYPQVRGSVEDWVNGGSFG